MCVSLRRLMTGPFLVLGAAGIFATVTQLPADAASTATIRVSGSLSVRSAASTSAPIIARLRNRASATVVCSVTGPSIRGMVRKTNQWDRLDTGGYISHAYVSTKVTFPACPPPAPPAPPPAPPAPAPPLGPTSTMTPTQFIAASAILAQQNQREFGVPASVTIAQAILESAWGRSASSANDRNFFGMKCATQGTIAIGCHVYSTFECAPDRGCYPTSASFRVYASAVDSFRDHGKLLAGTRYQAAFAHTTDPNQFIVDVGRAGYATDPAYATNVQNVMRGYNLYQYDQH
jgi:Mannosyl-glycoprotein endo-beta-N-acetylglucosaminidase